MTYHWMDADRAEVFTADPADRRELMAQIWYPARKDPSAARAAWVPDAEALAPALARASHPNTTRATGSSCGIWAPRWQQPCSARTTPTSR